MTIYLSTLFSKLFLNHLSIQAIIQLKSLQVKTHTNESNITYFMQIFLKFNLKFSCVYRSVGSLQSDFRPNIQDILPYPSRCSTRARVSNLWRCGHNGFQRARDEASKGSFACFLATASYLHPGKPNQIQLASLFHFEIKLKRYRMRVVSSKFEKLGII